MLSQNLAPWYSDARPVWEREVSDWLREVGHREGLGRVIAVTTVKERPWSVVRRVVYEADVSYFKACSEAGGHEPALHCFLEAHTALQIPHSKAVELPRGWILTADAGESLREAVSEREQAQVFGGLLARYAAMQMSTLPRVDQLLEIGLPDRRLANLPALLEELLALDATDVGRDENSWRGLRGAARRKLPLLEQVCAERDATSYAAGLDHGDLHQGNVLVRYGEARLADWGDACITHPFCSIMVTLETVLSAVTVVDRLVVARRLRDTYLEPWTALDSRTQLLVVFRQAMWLGRLLRALNCAAMFRAAPEAVLNRWRPLIFEQLRMWVEDEIPRL